jgi:CRISPR-associated endoribonuclease Cas6
MLSYWTIHFRNSGRIQNSMDTGRIWHGIFFDILKKYNEEISSEHHNKPSKQSFSISPILNENGKMGRFFQKGSYLKVNISLYDKDIHKGLMDFITKNKKMKFENIDLLIEEVSCKLIDEKLLEEQRIKRGCIKFITPTAFRINPVNYILPDPRRVFKNLSRSYSQIFDIEINHDEILEEIERNIIVEGLRINTEIAEYKKFQITGFVGEVTYRINHRKEETQKYLGKLLALAGYIGIGYKTGMGMGQCIVLRK